VSARNFAPPDTTAAPSTVADHTLANGRIEIGHRRQCKSSLLCFGREGNPKKATRTITVDMADSMRFTPAEGTVARRDGEACCEEQGASPP